MKNFYNEMTWPEIRDAVKQNKVALIPVGSIEDHGWHLPVMTDNLIAESICYEVARQYNDDVVVLPVAPYGFEEHHMDFPGSIDVNYATLIRLWADIGKSLAHHGFKKIVFINGHGSNHSALDLAAREVTIKTNAYCCMASWWNLVREEIGTIRESEFPGGCSHAGELETSLVMFLRPELVHKDYISKEIPKFNSKFMWRDLQRPSPVAFMDMWSRQTESGIIGDPTFATAEKGEKLFQMIVAKVGSLCQEFRKTQRKSRVDHRDLEEQ